MHRIGGWVQAVAAMTLALAGAAVHAEDAKPRGVQSTAARLADLQYVRTHYLPKEMAYTPATRAMAEAMLGALERQAGHLDEAGFAVKLAQIGALADNAHSGLRRNDAAVRPRSRLPLHLLWLSDALIVARANGAASDLAGARVLSVEGRSPAALYAGAKVLLGGNDAGRKIWLNDWIESEGILHALGLAAATDRLRLRVKLTDGRVVERTVAMVPAASLAPSPALVRLWSPEPLKDERGWKAALPLGDLPLYLRDADLPFRLEALPAQHALYLQFRSNEDEEGHPIADFLKEARARIERDKPENLVLDLRFDIGGNLLTTLDFLRKLPASVPGKTYLLVGEYTFSAGIISAAAVKKAGGERVIVIGDGLGDRSYFWSEGALVQLPNSRYSFRYADGQFNLAEGCAGEPGCMDDRYPAIDSNFASLSPAIRTPLDAAAYFARRDPALEAVAADLAARDARKR